MKHRWLLLVVLAGFLAVSSPAAGAPVGVYPEPAGKIRLFSENRLSFNQWHEQDRRHFDELCRDFAENPAPVTAAVYGEWREIACLMTKTAATEVYVDPERGYRIFPSRTTGKLHVLGVARTARKAFLDRVCRGLPVTGGSAGLYPALSLGSRHGVAGLTAKVTFQPVDESRYVSVATAAGVMNTLAVPAGAFRGYSLFLVPYEIAGLGGYSAGTGLPHVEEAAFISAAPPEKMAAVAPVIAHEAGHFLHQQYLGDLAGHHAWWGKYLALRGLTWQTTNWDEATPENFAEDFRVACGGPAAAARAYAAGYGAPGRRLKTEMAGFFREVASRPAYLPVEFDQIVIRPDPATAIEQINGLASSRRVVVTVPRFMVGGCCRVNDPAAQAVVLLRGRGYEKCLPLDRSPAGGFCQEAVLPAPGNYEVIVGTLRGKNITPCQIFQVDFYDFALEEQKKELAGM